MSAEPTFGVGNERKRGPELSFGVGRARDGRRASVGLLDGAREEPALFKGANFRTSLIWLLLLVAIFHFLLARMRFGNHVFAVGGNPGAAVGQGVNVRRVKVLNFVFTGAIAGFAGILLFSQFYTVRVASGDGMELSAIAASVVGGTLITGGAGSIWGAFVGSLIISTLRTGVVLMNIPFIPADNFDAVVGATIVLAAILNTYLRHRN